MLTRSIKTISQKHLCYLFATAPTANTYYKFLGVEKGATDSQIREAYQKLNQTISPDSDPTLFNKLNQAFVILTDSKARDAYDSLLKSRKTSYMSEPGMKVASSPSYYAERKAKTNEDIAKKFNLDAFGRYRGGVPQKNSEFRGSARGEIGELHKQADIDEAFPEYSQVTSEVADSFKEFHQDERGARTRRWPWRKMQVDYNYFSFNPVWWPYIKALGIIFVILPTIKKFLENTKKELEDERKFAKDLKKKFDGFTKERKEKQAL